MSEARGKLRPKGASIVLAASLGGAPALVATLVLLWQSDASPKITWTVVPLVVLSWIVGPLWLRDRVNRRLRTLANVLEAFREGDYSIRGRHHAYEGTLGSAMQELNALGDALRSHRLAELETSRLLERVVESIDVVVIAVDERGSIKLVNAAGARWLGQSAEQILGRDVAELGISALLGGPTPRLLRPDDLPPSVQASGGPFEIKRGDFRQAGRPHQLIVISDLRRALRDQEREAWQRLVRVLGHEINSSLAPIQSIGDTLLSSLRRPARDQDWEQDLTDGLEVISRRAGALNRFLTAYSKLARLPPPTPAPMDIRTWLSRAAALEQRVSVVLNEGEDATINADADQLDQMLINLLGNAAEASLQSHDGGEPTTVTMSWSVKPGQIEIQIADDGPGIVDTANLFVPFFTTKPAGSGIGLALARQIAELHDGMVTLQNRPDAPGAIAIIRLPAPTQQQASPSPPSPGETR